MNPPPSTPRQKVLVIEDDLLQRKLVVNTLRKLGVDDIFEADDRESAQDLITANSDGFDATICDLRLNVDSGLEILASSSNKQLGGVIILSALPSDVRAASAKILSQKGLAVLGCLPKPLDASRLRYLLGQANQSAPSNQYKHPKTKQHNFSESEIFSALRAKQFLAHYQPKLSLQTRSLRGLEALCRWQHPEYGLLAPGAFITLVETYGLISDLTEQMLVQACQLITETRVGARPLKVAVNISASSLQMHKDIQRLVDIVREAKVAPEQLIFELTESTFVQDDSLALELMTKLRIQGFGISLDDFGTGFTSLRQLRTLPVTELKLDRSFVTGASTSSRATHILESILGLAKSLHLNTVAEGIESETDAEFLAQMGCHEGQGYFLARPMSAEKLQFWMQGTSK